MRILIKFSVLILFTNFALASEKIYSDFAGYKNARVKKIESGSVRIMHEKGFADVPFEAISAKIKEELKINTSSAQNTKQIKKSDIEEMLKKIRNIDPSYEILKGKVFQVLGGVDVLVKLPDAEGTLVHVTTFTKKIFEGDAFVETVKFAGAYQYNSVIGSSKKVRSYVSLGPGAEIPPLPYCLTEERKFEAILKTINSDFIGIEDKEKIQPIIDYARNQIVLLKKNGMNKDARYALMIIESFK